MRASNRSLIATDDAELQLGDGRTLASKLVVGADGRQSLCRQAAQISRQDLGLRAERGDMHVRAPAAARRHLDRVPPPRRTLHGRALTGRACRASSGWSGPPIAQELAGLDEAAFRTALEERLQGLLGAVGEIGPRGVFPLSGMAAEVAGRNRVALVGEAVHVIPPIGAQGLNLGLRDAACIADCVADALAAGGDIGGAAGAGSLWPHAAHGHRLAHLDHRPAQPQPAVERPAGAGVARPRVAHPEERRPGAPLAIREGLAPSFIAPRLMQPADRSGRRTLTAARPASA